MIPYSMKQDDARKLDHATLEAMRIRAVRSVQAGENPEVVARSLRISRRTIYGWLAQYRRGGWGAPINAMIITAMAGVEAEREIFGHCIEGHGDEDCYYIKKVAGIV
jgi:transposase